MLILMPTNSVKALKAVAVTCIQCIKFFLRETGFDDRCAVAKFSKTRVSSKVPEGSTPIFGGRLPEFPYKTLQEDMLKGALMPKTNPIRSAVTIKLRLETDWRTNCHS